uniref:Uncharacterized protein n=1 Tax=Heterorhabditis bacteriophora TaxID=37862 RepID=A0A1I7X716_HETBA
MLMICNLQDLESLNKKLHQKYLLYLNHFAIILVVNIPFQSFPFERKLKSRIVSLYSSHSLTKENKYGLERLKTALETKGSAEENITLLTQAACIFKDTSYCKHREHERLSNHRFQHQLHRKHNLWS